jgi:hypothetical protein
LAIITQQNEINSLEIIEKEKIIKTKDKILEVETNNLNVVSNQLEELKINLVNQEKKLKEKED